MSSCKWVDLNAVVARLHISFVAIRCHCHTSISTMPLIRQNSKFGCVTSSLLTTWRVDCDKSPCLNSRGTTRRLDISRTGQLAD